MRRDPTDWTFLPRWVCACCDFSPVGHATICPLSRLKRTRRLLAKCPAQSGKYGTKYCTSGVQCSSDRQFQEGPTMSFRILGSVMCVSLFALATVTHAQNAPQTTANSNVKVAQGTTQPGPAGAPAKTSKGKVKKAKSGKGTGSGGSESRPPAPAGGSGPPDPGKYL